MHDSWVFLISSYDGCTNNLSLLQDEIEHLEPGPVPSTVDPDVANPPLDKGKKTPQHPIRISAWKLAKLDSNEAIKAAARARASSSVLRPLSSCPHPFDADPLSSSNASGKSSPVSSIDQVVHTRSMRAGMPWVSSTKSSYPPSRTSKDNMEACAHSLSNLSNPHPGNFTPSPLEQRPASSRDHFNPIFQHNHLQISLLCWQVLVKETTMVMITKIQFLQIVQHSDL
ncbi:hypothetical protein Ancab_007058 [Ancistrocladus abbreviatus]